MDIRLLQTLCDEGIMGELYKSGFIGPKVFVDRDIFLWVDLQVKTRAITKNQAVLEAEIRFQKSRASIWNALKRFK